MYGSATCDANSHTHKDLPVLLADGGNGQIPGGRHIQYETGTPMTNLYLSRLNCLNVNVDPWAIAHGALALCLGIIHAPKKALHSKPCLFERIEPSASIGTMWGGQCSTPISICGAIQMTALLTWKAAALRMLSC